MKNILYTHMTDKSFKKKDFKQSGEFTSKPYGTWFSYGFSWLEWCELEMPEWVGKHHYELKIDFTHILVIENIDDLRELHKKYGGKPIEGYTMEYIAWQKLAINYDGIAFPNFHSVKHKMMYEGRIDTKLNDLYLKATWYNGVDCDSGCIWNKKAIKKATLMDPEIVENNKC